MKVKEFKLTVGSHEDNDLWITIHDGDILVAQEQDVSEGINLSILSTVVQYALKKGLVEE